MAPDRRKLLDELRLRQLRMHDLLQSKLLAIKNRMLDLAKRRVFCLPLERLRDRERDLDDRGDRLYRAMQKRVQLARKGVEVAAAKLESLSPLNVLARGYSLTRREADLAVVRGAGQVAPGERIVTQVQQGRIVSRVEAVEASDSGGTGEP